MDYQKILRSRFIFSVLWTTFLHIFPLTIFLLVTNFSVVHPVIWVKETLLKIFTLSTWIFDLPLRGLIVLLGIVVARHHTTPPIFSASRFQLFCSFFTKNTFLRALACFLTGLVIPWIYLGLNNVNITDECSSAPKQRCLNEQSVFIICSGMWTSVHVFWHMSTEKCLQFPVIQQLKFLQIRSQFPGVLKQSLKSAAFALFTFVCLYYWYGNMLCSIFKKLFKAQMETASLTTISGLFNLPLFLHAWLIAAVYFSIVKTLQSMIQIHFTEHYSFDLTKQASSNSVLLSTALSEQNIPLIQYLAFYDLFMISTSKKALRCQIFTLSQPGGHPHTWNTILQECLKLINNFIGEIESIYRLPEPEKPPKPLPKHIHIHDMTLRDHLILSSTEPLTSACRMRNLVSPIQKTQVPESNTRLDELKSKMNSYIAEIYKNSVITYFFANLPDAKISYFVSNSQPVIWATQSIAELSANALIEDQFGIVLKDLPVIINTLLQLKSSTDKLGNIQKKLQKREHDICMKTALRSAVRRSLYKIAIAYSEYLTDLPLTPENFQSMQSFVNFKEC